MTELAVDLRDVFKTYRTGLFGRGARVEALRGVSLQVRRGEVFGLLGPNGAGKSTLVKTMMSVIRPTAAGGTVLGRPVGDKPTLARVGYLPENHRFPPYLTGRQVIEFFGGLQGVPRRQRRKRAGELLETVGMGRWGDTRITRYSKGMSQRVGLAQALVADPELVVLDEPTDGVDPVARREVRQVMTRMADEGRTVLVNSHQLSELEQVSDRVAIMVGGLVHSVGTVDELALGQTWHELDVPEDARLPQGLVAEPREGRRTVKVMTDDPAAVQPVLDTLRAAGVTVLRLAAVRPSLEDLFVQAVEGDGRDGMAAGSRQ